MRHFVATFVLFVLLFVGCAYERPTISQGDSTGGGEGGGGFGGMSTLDCSPGHVCNCQSKNCAIECGELGCIVATCVDATCTATCGMPNPPCIFNCFDGSNCTDQCPNGNCKMTCDNNSTCKLACPAGGCTMNCYNKSECTLECGNMLKPCTVNCMNGNNITCNGPCNLNGC